MERIKLRVEEISAVEREDWPVTSGIPLAQYEEESMYN